MPSFDVVSELNMHELTNAIDQANREVSTRFDFKGTNSSYTLDKETIKIAIQEITLKKGIAADIAKKIVKYIKESKAKVQASIQGDQVRVTGKKRDDLQEVIALLKEHVELPVQFVNFRD